MKIELPLETWTELFGFVPRSQLMQLVPHIGEEQTCDSGERKCQQTIGDRQFVSYVQFFLHKFGEVTLGQLHIYGNGPIVIANGKGGELPLAVVPIPQNVKNFKSILISDYGESVIAFLAKFQQNSLLENLNVYFHNCPALLQIMTNFVPLFTSINSIQIGCCHSNVLAPLQSEYSELATPMFTSARVLLTDYNGRDYWFCDWLRIPREDGEPRVLILDGYKNLFPQPQLSHSKFINHIAMDFLEANQQAVSFFIKLKGFSYAPSVQSLALENGKTQEKLVIKGANGIYDPVTISRYPIGTNEEGWNEEMSQRPNRDNREIGFDA